MFSIVIPTYNRKDSLLRAINSIYNQSFTNWEILIVDNFSNDGTKEMIQGLNNNKVKFFEIHNEGIIASSRNKGIKEARGEYITFLDSDDWWKKNKLEKIFQYTNDNYDFIYHKMEIVKNYKKTIFKSYIYSWQVKSIVRECLVYNGNPIVTSSVAVKSSLIKNINGFSEDKELIAAEDFDCWLRISLLSERFKYIDDSLGYWLQGDNTSNPMLSLKFLKRLKELHFGEFDIDPIWWQYSLARSKYLLKKEDAIDDLQKLSKQNISFTIKIKVLFMLFYLRLINFKLG
tara:strand:- start:14496 stop:15359 length:864 start_codon:yes stop_codon:yes gene_type:complete